ncbi:hypothetical protein B0H67DRAFT_598018 [Lasiosphaeris hirsuta]|uniref:SIT4 phosphatase-associated protein n=1 Tax=Lasiosphaeris hirsuta TaxID=260670 RepID=A0AA40AYH5_9PEZI|nr:hypothetical protein B0H67DRAFT_598018 [Lasiosphaeris hirsuta]
MAHLQGVFRAYTDPLNANNSTSMNPPSIPPPPPPPPPLNIPPSRARLQLAARLAMNKRNAAAAANGGQEGTSASTDDAGPENHERPNAANSDRLRNPFADDDDDDDVGSGSGSGSDDGEVGNLGGEGVGSSSWNRGSWWRGVVRSARRSDRKNDADKASSKEATERFGDGRDDSDDSDGPGDEEDDVEEDIEDEEFGDFAMPEVGSKDGNATSGGLVTGIDPAREKILLKPLPVHPSSIKSSVSPFSSLWPFSTQSFGSKEKDVKEDNHVSAADKALDLEKTIPGEEKTAEMPIKPDDVEEVVVGEDGKKIDRAIEAKRRTSIEDPDDDERGALGSLPSGSRRH